MSRVSRAPILSRRWSVSWLAPDSGSRIPDPGLRNPDSGRAGFTLVELVVAIVILSVGLLGLASTAAVVTRQMGGSAQQTIAANLATARFETMRSITCTGIAGGTANTRGLTEVWTVATTTTTRARLVTDTVKWFARGRPKRVSYTSMIPCV